MTERISKQEAERLLAGATPGPWLSASKRSSIVGLPVVGPMGAAIANVHSRDEALANACLIAAAPALAATVIAQAEEIERKDEALLEQAAVIASLRQRIGDPLPPDLAAVLPDNDYRLEIVSLREALRAAEEALLAAEEYFDNRADADQPPGCTPIPNEEMSLLVESRAALSRIREALR